MGLNTSGAGGPHHGSHENGGTDEVDATGLTGVGGGGGASPTKQTHVYRNTGQVITTGVLTAVTFTTEFRDDDGDWAVSPNPTRIIITQDGTYDIVGGTEWDGNVAGTFRRVGIYKNGVLLHQDSRAPASFMLQGVVDYGVTLVNGDYLELKVTQDSGSNSTILGGETVSYLLASRGGDESFLQLDVGLALRGAAPYAIYEHPSDGTTAAYVSFPGSGRLLLLARGDLTHEASVDINFGDIFATTTGDIYLEPDGLVVIDTGGGLVLPTLSSDPVSPYDQSQLYYNTGRHRMRINRKPDGSTDLWQDLVAQGNATHAFPQGWVPGGTYATALTLPANGGAIACPILVPAPMIVSTIQVWNTDTTGAREFEANLYLDNWASATAVQAQGGSGGDAYVFGSWTSSGAALQGADYPGGDPIWLEAGIVWLVIRNTHATNTLGIGSLTAAGTFSSMNSHQTKTLGSFLDATLDLVTGWSKATAIPGIVLRGRVLAQSTPW